MSVSGRKRTTRLGEDEGMTSEDRMWGDKSGNEVSSNDVKTKKYRKQGNKYNSKNIRRGVHEPLDETSQSEESGVARNWKNSKSQKQRKYEFLKWSGKKKVRGVGEDGFFESRGDSEKMVKKKKISEEVVKEKLTPYEKWAQKNKKKYEKFYGYLLYL